MTMTDLTDSQKQVLTSIAQRLRKQAQQLDNLIRSGDPERLAHACGMLHAAETQLLWVHNGVKQNSAPVRRLDCDDS